MLPLEDRRLGRGLVSAENDDEILLEVSDSIRESLIQAMDKGGVLAAVESLDTDRLLTSRPTCRMTWPRKYGPR